MNDAPEPFLQIRRHVMCCGMTYMVNRYPKGDRERDVYLEQNAVADVEAWAKTHSMTCPALKASDDDQ